MPRKCIQVWFRLKESKGANSNFRLKIKCSPKINSTIVRTWHSFVNHVSAWTNNHTFMQILLNLYNFYYSICKFKPFETLCRLSARLHYQCSIYLISTSCSCLCCRWYSPVPVVISHTSLRFPPASPWVWRRGRVVWTRGRQKGLWRDRATPPEPQIPPPSPWLKNRVNREIRGPHEPHRELQFLH